MKVKRTSKCKMWAVKSLTGAIICGTYLTKKDALKEFVDNCTFRADHRDMSDLEYFKYRFENNYKVIKVIVTEL